MQYLTTAGKLGYDEINSFTSLSILDSYVPIINDSITIDPDSISLHDCKSNNTIKFAVEMSMASFNIILFHPKYNTPYVKAKSN